MSEIYIDFVKGGDEKNEQSQGIYYLNRAVPKIRLKLNENIGNGKSATTRGHRLAAREKIFSSRHDLQWIT